MLRNKKSVRANTMSVSSDIKLTSWQSTYSLLDCEPRLVSAVDTCFLRVAPLITLSCRGTMGVFGSNRRMVTPSVLVRLASAFSDASLRLGKEKTLGVSSWEVIPLAFALKSSRPDSCSSTLGLFRRSSGCGCWNQNIP